MAYFLPSYFQKRLLRYALSRLDFIDSNALDLDNLDLTIGQRSVVELKLVAIQVDKLVERLALPPAILPKNATVEKLRIVVPADLHASGIEVEIDGIDITIHLNEPVSEESEPSKRTSTQHGNEPSHKDIANRPRLASSSLHDPGGEHVDHVLPRPRDLAESFLEAEPEHERQELEAVVQSQSVRLHQSRAHLDHAAFDDGIGLAEGFSLPGFVTNFLAGIADRLSVSLRHVAISLVVPGTGSDSLQLILKVEQFDLDPVQNSTVAAKARRKVRILGVELLMVTDQDTLSAKSRPSSPKLTRSRFVPSPTSQRGRSPEISKRASEMQSLPKSPPSNSTSSSFHSNSEDGIGPGDSMLGSQIFSSTIRRSEESSPVEAEAEADASALEPHSGSASMASAQRSRSLSPNLDSTPDRDALAESMLYSHAEAQSMYMSAMSNAHMPGAFDGLAGQTDSRSARQEDLVVDDHDISTREAAVLERGNTPPPRLPSTSRAKSPVMLSISPSDCVKRLLRANDIVIEIPSPPSATDDVNASYMSSTSPAQSSPYPSRRSLEQSMRSGSLHKHKTSDQSMYDGIPQSRKKIVLDQHKTTEIQVRDIEMFLDVTICGVLLKTASKATQLLTYPDDSPLPAKAEEKAQPHEVMIQAGVRSLVIHLMDSVPDVSKTASSEMPPELTASMFSASQNASILQLQILNIDYQMVQNKFDNEQKLTVRRLGLYQGSNKYLSFFDTAQLQDSFVSSSIVGEPHDIVVQRAGERVEVNTKPMHIMLDLLVIDEVLSRSGGLSSLLDLGSSIASTDTVKGKVSKLPDRRRSVHFVEPKPALPTNEEPTTGLKINVRINGLLIDLVGSESSVQVKTSAVKIIQRSSGLKLSIASTSIYGPLVQDSQSLMPLVLKIRGIVLEFRDKPYENDLDRLLSLLVPSSDKYEADDDIMVDTLLRQRRKGSLLQLNVDDIQFRATTLEWLPRLVEIIDEISKLSSVAKYLPEDDKPGLLSFIHVKNINLSFQLSDKHDPLSLNLKLLEAAHITVPALMAVQTSSLVLKHGHNDAVLHALLPGIQEQTLSSPPMMMCRFIPDEMEPTIKLKLANTVFEYSVTLLVSMTKLAEDARTALSVEPSRSPLPSELSTVSTDTASDASRRVRLSVAIRNSAVMLRPVNLASAGLFFLKDTTFSQKTSSHGISASLSLNKASIMIVDDLSKIGATNSSADAKLYFDQNDTVQELVKLGYVPVGTFSGAVADLLIDKKKGSDEQFVDVEFKNNLLYLETCADSTQTLIQILGGLSPPTAPSKQERFRTQIVPLEDMLASFTGNAFVSEKGPQLGMSIPEESTVSSPAVHTGQTPIRRSAAQDLTTSIDQDEMYGPESLGDPESLVETVDESTELARSSHSDLGGASVHIAPVNPVADEGIAVDGSIMMHSLIDFRNNHFTEDSSVGGTAHRWDSTQNTYGMSNERTGHESPMKIRIRDVHIIWNLFDGYDWENTRDVITQAVRDVEDKALAKQQRRMQRRATMMEEDDESVIGDVLFNSIYISIPTKGDPRDLTSAINMDLGDVASETASQTGSYATSTTVTATPSKRHSIPRPKSKKLRLRRSKQHKMTFELEGLAVDFLAFPPNSGEVESSVDIRVQKLDIFDHVPTSTWRKFATYMHESGEREVGTDQVHIELLNVKPVEELAASEIIMKMTVLPLRLHVDQDALDFLTRFFEFKDDRTAPSTTPSNPPFIQRVEVNPIKVRLDFKPKRVDYGGLKSGRTTEFMNFFILERADLVLRRVILYGVSGFDRMGIMLNNIWTPDVRNNQLPTVLAGLTPLRSLVDVGSGVRDLVAIPIREYRKDGRIVRSIQKGAMAFAKTTTTELVNLGAKLAIGTQTVLQTAEDVLAPQNRRSRSGDASDSSDDEQPHIVSHYADQPVGIVQGLRGAYASLERDLLLARDAIVAVPGEIMAEGSATGAAKAVLKTSPTIILRPAIGVTKAVGTALLGAGNTLDKGNRRRIEDKYKSR